MKTKQCQATLYPICFGTVHCFSLSVPSAFNCELQMFCFLLGNADFLITETLCYIRASWEWKPLWTAGVSVSSWTHHVWLIHLDGHFTDSVCCFVDHFQEAGAAQSLGAHCSGQLKINRHILQYSYHQSALTKYGKTSDTQRDQVEVNWHRNDTSIWQCSLNLNTFLDAIKLI